MLLFDKIIIIIKVVNQQRSLEYYEKTYNTIFYNLFKILLKDLYIYKCYK